MRLRNAREFLGRYAQRKDGVVGAVILLVFAVLALAPQLFVGPLQTVTTPPAPPWTHRPRRTFSAPTRWAGTC